MANEGQLGKWKISSERVSTDDHPAIIQALVMDIAATEPLPVGTLLKRVEGTSETGVTYAVCTSADIPCAVVDVPFDPTGENGETSAICVLHGTVKTRLLKVGAGQPTLGMIDELQKSGIFAV